MHVSKLCFNSRFRAGGLGLLRHVQANKDRGAGSVKTYLLVNVQFAYGIVSFVFQSLIFSLISNYEIALR